MWGEIWSKVIQMLKTGGLMFHVGYLPILPTDCDEGTKTYISLENMQVHPWSLTARPLKNDGWKTILSYWVSVTFQGLFLFNLGGE